MWLAASLIVILSSFIETIITIAHLFSSLKYKMGNFGKENQTRIGGKKYGFSLNSTQSNQ